MKKNRISTFIRMFNKKKAAQQNKTVVPLPTKRVGQKERKVLTPEELLKDIPTKFKDEELSAWEPAIRSMERLIQDFYKKKNAGNPKSKFDASYKEKGTYSQNSPPPPLPYRPQ